jgi:hypothetical protein
VALAGSHKGAQPQWQGEIHGDVVGAMPWNPEKDLVEHPVSITGSDGVFVLAPLSLMAPGQTPGLTIGGTATLTGFTLRLTGTATADEVLKLRATLPPLGDGLQEALPDLGAGTATKALKIDVTCTRLWEGAQHCAANAPAVKKTKHRRR